MPQFLMKADEELRLRELANEIAKGIDDALDIIKRLGFTSAEYNELCETRTFRDMLDQAFAEWGGAVNTPKRVKLKAAANIENALPDMFAAMVNENEPLSSRVKVFETMARIGGLGNPEPALTDNGQYFKLEIHMAGGAAPPLIIENVAINEDASNTRILEPDAVEASRSQSYVGDISPSPAQSYVLATVPFESMD